MEKVKQLTATWPGHGKLPEMNGAEKGTILANALTSEAHAKAALQELENCVNEPMPDLTSGGGHVPPAMAAQIAKSIQAKNAKCIATARQISEKYPALRDEVKQRILRKSVR
jgi:hypothetical protein